MLLVLEVTLLAVIAEEEVDSKLVFVLLIRLPAEPVMLDGV